MELTIDQANRRESNSTSLTLRSRRRSSNCWAAPTLVRSPMSRPLRPKPRASVIAVQMSTYDARAGLYVPLRLFVQEMPMIDVYAANDLLPAGPEALRRITEI